MEPCEKRKFLHGLFLPPQKWRLEAPLFFMVAAKATREALVLFSLLVNLSFRAVNSSALDKLLRRYRK